MRLKGIEPIARIHQRAGSRIRIMAVGGIRAATVRSFALQTGVREVHTSMNTSVQSAEHNGQGELGTRQFGSNPFVVREQEVRIFKSALQTIPDLTANRRQLLAHKIKPVRARSNVRLSSGLS